MSRRLPASPLLIAFLVLAGGALLPFLAQPAAAYGERTYEANQVINAANLVVFSGQSVAQSFTATQTYRLLSVTLRLQNVGSLTDTINVSIRSSAGNKPAATYLAANQVISGGTTGLVDFPFTSAPILTKGERYWIVAANGAAVSTDGYRWFHSNDNNSYLGGWAEVNLGLGWITAPTPTDMYFVTYGREYDANLTVAMTATTPTAAPKGLVTFTIDFNNTGTSAAKRVWINETLAAGFTYISDTAGSNGTYPNFVFSDVPNGVHSFTVTAKVDIGVAPGTVLTNVATLSYANATWAIRPGSSARASVTVGLVTKPLYLVPVAGGPPQGLTPVRPTGGLALQRNLTLQQGDPPTDFDLNPRLARSFRALNLTVYLFLDSKSGAAKDLDVNLTLMDWNGASLVPVAYLQQRVRTNAFVDYQKFAFPFAPLDYLFAPGQQVRLRVKNMASSADEAFLAINSTFAESRLEFLTPTYVQVNSLELRDLSGPATTWTSLDGLVVRANISDPFGSSEISGARINVTAPGGTLVANYVAMTIVATDPGTPSAWKLFQFAMGPPLANGTYRVEVVAIEGNGVVDVAEASALVRSPSFTLEKLATVANAKSGDRYSYDIWYNNTGTGPAGQVWLNDSLPSQVNFLSSSAPAAQTGNYNWTWTAVAPGSYRLQIDVQVKGGLAAVAYFRNYASLNFTDEKGHRWPMRLAYVDVAFRGPVIALSMTTDKSTVHSKEMIGFLFTMANSGDAAQTLWLNVTLPANLAYVSDTAGSLSGTSAVSGNVVYFRFSNLPAATTWTLTLTAQAGSNLTSGAVLGSSAGLNYTNSNGILMPPRATNASVTVFAPRIPSASLTITGSGVKVGDVIPAVINYENLGNEAAQDLWINLTLDAYLRFVNASSPAAGAGTDVRFSLTSIGTGAHWLLLNVSVAPSVPDLRALTINGTLDYTDRIGNRLPRVSMASNSVQAAAPRITLSVLPGNATVEAGTRITYAISHANAGSGTAGDVWLNLSLPASFVYVSDTSMGTRSVLGSRYSWHWTSQAPGPGSFTVELYAKTSVADGSSVDLPFTLDYTDLVGGPRPGTATAPHATFAAPVIELDLVQDRTEVLAGGNFTYTLRVRNVGTAAAMSLWLLDSVDNRLEIVSFTSRVAASGGRNLNWTFADLLPGQEETITLRVRALEGLAARTLISNVLEAVYTNSVGTVIGYARSAPVTVSIVADIMPLYYILVGGFATTPIAVFFVRRRHNVQIEEAFLVYRDGVLMYHLSRSLVQDKDEDVLSGMLTAVQEFVRDAFRYGEHRELHQLDFGDYRIIIERGKNVYLAVVHSGSESSALRKQVRTVLDHIETSYGGVLEKWDGDMDKVVGARDVIRDYLLKPNGRHPKPTAKPA